MAFKDDLAALIENSEQLNTDDVAKLVGKHFIPKTEYNTKNSELKTLQEQLEEERNKNLTVEQQLQAKLDKAIADAESKQKEFTLKSNNLEVEKLFTQAGISQDDYKDLLGTIVSEDLDKSVTTAQSFISVLEKTRNVTKQDTTKELLDATPEITLGDLPNDPSSHQTIRDEQGVEWELGTLPD